MIRISILTLKDHIKSVKKDSFSVLRNFGKRKQLFTENQLKIIVNSLVVYKLEYCNALYSGINERQFDELQRIQNAAAKTILGLHKLYDHLGESLKQLHWLPIKLRMTYKILLIFYKCMATKYLVSMISYTSYNHFLNLKESPTNTIAGHKRWDGLPIEIKSCSSISSFKTALKTYLFREAYHD